MNSRRESAHDLVVPSNFIRAIRESGYASVSTALAELVDNSIQASASDIDIRVTRPSTGDLPRIEVEDNGRGMNSQDLAACLRFGGSSRFDERTSFGRFGMGLPAASLSQARCVEVTAWRPGMSAQSVELDVASVASGEQADLTPRPSARGRSRSGCRVVWSECDRIEYQRLVWLERAVRRDLGRMFRKSISDGLRIAVNGTTVTPVDPTFLTTAIDGHRAKLAVAPLEYELDSPSGDSSNVRVTFSLLPIERWHALDNAAKRKLGVVGQASVSILRAGREIASGWHLMGAKRKENYDDWWRCQIEFDPPLDEHFGITINKQGIRPSPTLRKALEPDLEAIARMLNERVRQTFEDIKFQASSDASCKIAGAADRDLPILGGQGKSSGSLQYRIGSAPLPLDRIFRTELKRRTLELTLNVDHPAFAALYKPLQAMDASAAAELRTAVELLMLALARTSLHVGSDSDEMLRSWSETYGRMLQRS